MQNKLFATMITALLVLLMAGSAMCATYDSNVTLENKDTSTWKPILTDDITALVEYNSVGEEFAWHVDVTAVPNTEYSLIYYADKPNRFEQWGGNNPGALIVTFATDSNGDFDDHGYTELGMDLPCDPDANMNISEHDYCGTPDFYNTCTGAKIWIVPTAALPDPYPGDGEWKFWNSGGILFETKLITYEDCDEFYTQDVPANATFNIEDTFNVATVPIMILNATNAGSVDMTLTYDPAVVTFTGITNGNMDSMFYNDGTVGAIRIGAYQGNSAGLNGDFVLAYVSFAPLGSEPCDFGITVKTYKDATPCGRSMPYDVSVGRYCSYDNGDVNGDGDVDIFDAMYLAKHVLVKAGFENIIECAADVDGSGNIDIADAGRLAGCVVGKEGYCPLE